MHGRVKDQAKKFILSQICLQIPILGMILPLIINIYIVDFFYIFKRVVLYYFLFVDYSISSKINSSFKYYYIQDEINELKPKPSFKKWKIVKKERLAQINLTWDLRSHRWWSFNDIIEEVKAGVKVRK